MRAVLIFLFVLLIVGCATSNKATKVEQEGRAADDIAPGAQYDNEILPGPLVALLAQAKAAADAEKYEQASQILDSAKQSFATYPQIDLNQALIAFKQQDYPLAQSFAESSLKARADYPPSYNMLGVVHRAAGNFEASKQAYQKAIAINSKYPNALLNLGVLADLYLQDYPLALQSFEAYLAINSDDERVNNWVVELKRRMPQAGETL